MGKIHRTCEFGIVHFKDNCRCPCTLVTVRRIKCDVPNLHGPGKPVEMPTTFSPSVSTSETVSTVTPLHDRLRGVLERELGVFILPVVTNAVTDQLEAAIVSWLRESALDEFTKQERIR
jgi:hypothetical protein